MDERFVNLLWAGTREHTTDWATSIWLCRPCFMRAQRILQEFLAIGTCQARHWLPSDVCLGNQIQSLDTWTILSAVSQLCTVDRCFTISQYQKTRLQEDSRESGARVQPQEEESRIAMKMRGTLLHSEIPMVPSVWSNSFNCPSWIKITKLRGYVGGSNIQDPRTI